MPGGGAASGPPDGVASGRGPCWLRPAPSDMGGFRVGCRTPMSAARRPRWLNSLRRTKRGQCECGPKAQPLAALEGLGSASPARWLANNVISLRHRSGSSWKRARDVLPPFGPPPLSAARIPIHVAGNGRPRRCLSRPPFGMTLGGDWSLISQAGSFTGRSREGGFQGRGPPASGPYMSARNFGHAFGYEGFDERGGADRARRDPSSSTTTCRPWAAWRVFAIGVLRGGWKSCVQVHPVSIYIGSRLFCAGRDRVRTAISVRGECDQPRLPLLTDLCETMKGRRRFVAFGVLPPIR